MYKNLDAESVSEFVDDAKRSLLTLEENLNSLGYRFSNPRGPVQLADNLAIDSVRLLESRFGEIPILARRWYEVFCCVDFSQDQSQLHGEPGDPVAGLGLNCSLIFMDINWCLRAAESTRTPRRHDSPAASQSFIPVGGFASNCDPRGLWLPDSSIDPVLFNEGAGPVTMAQSVIHAIACGGFPFWSHMFRRRRFTSPLRVTPDFAAIHPALLRNLTHSAFLDPSLADED